MKKSKEIIAWISFVSSIIIGFLALFLPPIGIIDKSVLWFIAQMLLFSANILGINYNVFNTDKVSQSK